MGLLAKVLDILYPEKNICLYCGRKYLFSELKGICDNCLTYIEFLDHFCLSCGREMDQGEEVCTFCQNHPYVFDRSRSIGLYDGLLKELILQFKYKACQEICRPLVELLYIGYLEYYHSERVDRIVPVPIHAKRLQERGYNQAELLARGLSLKTGLPLSTALKRIKDSSPLYDYAYQERKDLLENSFSIEKGAFSGEKILLLDDIFTTGATANEISVLLKEVAGARKVLVLTVATAHID